MKNAISKFVAVAALAVSVVAAPAIAGPLDGDTVHTEYLFPDTGSIYQDFGETTISGNTLLASGAGTSGLDISASGSSILADYSSVSPSSWNPSAFNGFSIFDDTNSAAAFTSVSIDPITNLAGFDASRVSFDADHIYVNWQGLSFDQNTKVGLQINSVAAVPETATWLMMILGFGAIGGVMRRAHRKSEERFTSQVRAIAAA